MLTTKPRAMSGQVRRWTAQKKATNPPGVISFRRTSSPPYRKTITTPIALIACIMGPIEPRSLARAKLRSR